jgi:hypothetical protein
MHPVLFYDHRWSCMRGTCPDTFNRARSRIPATRSCTSVHIRPSIFDVSWTKHVQHAPCFHHFAENPSIYVRIDEEHLCKEHGSTLSSTLQTTVTRLERLAISYLEFKFAPVNIATACSSLHLHASSEMRHVKCCNHSKQPRYEEPVTFPRRTKRLYPGCIHFTAI